MMTHRKRKIPWLGHSEVTGHDVLHVPHNDEADERVEDHEAEHVEQRHLVVDVDGAEEIAPLHADTWTSANLSQPLHRISTV